MKCPDCNGETMVVKTTSKDDCVNRQRKCQVCGHQFHTQESKRQGVKVTTRRKKGQAHG